jgi:hypothetical protein
MTLDAFFAALQETPREWFINDDGEIRCHSDDPDANHCPLSRVADVQPCSIIGARQVLDLSLEAYSIAAAADGSDSGHPHLRARLLAACGLTEARA